MKDPAALFYIDTWLTATAEMDADCKGWYLNLILHQYDKKSLPNDLEKLAVLAGVKFSEYDRFKQVFEQVLKYKFTLNETGRLENDFAKNIIQNRELFKDKRSNAGKISYCLKYLNSHFPAKYRVKPFIEYFKENADIENIDTKNEQMIKQVFEQMFELYRNINTNTIKWREDYNYYLELINEAKEIIFKDSAWLKQQSEYNPKLNIEKSIERTIKEYWGTEKGWKRKKNSKVVNIDMVDTLKSTYENNKVWKNPEQLNAPPQSEIKTNIPYKKIGSDKNGTYYTYHIKVDGKEMNITEAEYNQYNK